MNKTTLKEYAVNRILTLIETDHLGYTKTVEIPFNKRGTKSFLVSIKVKQDEFTYYQLNLDDCAVCDEVSEREYPLVCDLLCGGIQDLFDKINLENKHEYEQSLTGRALRDYLNWNLS